MKTGLTDINKGERIYKKNGAIEFLRILATSLILMHHYQQFTGTRFERYNFYGTFPWGHIVEFFFLLSGYLSYKHIDNIGINISFKEFMLKKAIRLLPITAIGAAFQQISFFVGELLSSKMRVLENPWDCLNIWTFVVAALGIDSGGAIKQEKLNFVTWYISVLMLCYCVFAIITILCHKNNTSANYGYLIMVFAGISIVTYGIDLPYLNIYAARGYYAFFWGVLIKWVLNKIKNKKTFNIICLIIVSVLGIYLTKIHLLYDDWGVQYILTFLFYPGILFLCENEYLISLFNKKIFLLLGDCSYEVYVFQLPFIYFFMFIANCFGIDYSARWYMFAFVVFMWIVGIVLYLSLQVQIRKVCDRFYS